MLATSNEDEVEKLPYWLNVLIAIDQLGNAIAGGNPDNTISGRVGFFASDGHRSKIKTYWKALERVIDFTFEPLQGPRHCYHAWKGEPDEADSEVTYITRMLLGIFVVVGCFFISIALWLAILIKPSWRYQAGETSYEIWRQKRQASKGPDIAAVPAIPPVTPTPEVLV